MPVGGGVFTQTDKVLPGAYINFVSTPKGFERRSRGVVALPLSLSWGEEGKVIRVDREKFQENSMELLGAAADSSDLLLIREALKRARLALICRVNSGGVKATKTTGGVTATAKYAGEAGNHIGIVIETVVDQEGMVDVVTRFRGKEVDRQTVTASAGAKQLKPNPFVSFSGTGAISAQTLAMLTGGTNGTVNGEGYKNALKAIEKEHFDTIAYCGSDESVKGVVRAFVLRLRDEDGRKVVGVLTGLAANHIGMINVKNGVILTDGTVVSAENAVAWVAGASAAAEINESLTNAVYEGAIDVDTKYTKKQFEQAIKAGEFVFYADSGKARVLSDINSQTTFESGGVTEDWTSNRVVRVLDGWANETARIFGEHYIGRITNDATGRNLFKADLIRLAENFVSAGAIRGFDASDIEIKSGTGKRDVEVSVGITPTDAMEKLYMVVSVA